MLLAAQLPTSEGLAFSFVVFMAVIFCPIVLSGVAGALVVRFYKHQNQAALAGIISAVYVGAIAWWILGSPVTTALSQGPAASTPILLSHVISIIGFGTAGYRESKQDYAKRSTSIRRHSLRHSHY